MTDVQVTKNSGEKLSSCCIVCCLLEVTVKNESYFTGKHFILENLPCVFNHHVSLMVQPRGRLAY